MNGTFRFIREIKTMEEQNKHKDVVYEEMLEYLRQHLNILNTTIFLLKENMNSVDVQTLSYFDRINNEIEKIRKVIIEPLNES